MHSPQLTAGVRAGTRSMRQDITLPFIRTTDLRIDKAETRTSERILHLTLGLLDAGKTRSPGGFDE